MDNNRVSSVDGTHYLSRAVSLNIRCVLLSAAETLDKYHARQYPAGGCGEVSCAALRLPPPAAGAAHLPAPRMDLQYPRLLCSPLRHPHIRLLDIRCHCKKLYLIVDTLLKVKIVHLSSVFTASAQLQDNSEYLFVCCQAGALQSRLL